MALDTRMWFQRINRCIEYQGEKRQERLQALRLYTSTYFSMPTTDNTEEAEVNFLFEFVDVMLSATYARYPKIFVSATSANRTSFANTMQFVVNYYFRDKEFKPKIKKAIKEAILIPPGWMFTGYKMVKETSRDQRQLEQEFPELKDTKQEKTEEQRGILDETIKIDDIFIDWVSSFNVVWPRGHHNIRSCPYIIVIENTNLEDVINNDGYNDNKFKIRGLPGGKGNKKPHALKLNSPTPQITSDTSAETDLETIDVKLFHIFDRRNQKFFTLADGLLDGALINPKDWPWMPDGFPLFELIFHDVPPTDEECNSYPLSDVTPMLAPLKELSMISGSMLRHRKRSGTVILYEEGGIGDTEAANIQNSMDMDAVKVNNKDKIEALTPPGLPNDYYKIRQQILEDLLRISGYNQLLANQPGIDTATESDNVREGARLRTSQKVDIIEDYTKKIARYVSGLIWQFKTRDEISEILGEPVNENMWPDLPEDFSEARKVIQKELNFSIEAGSTRPPKDEAIERKQITDIVSVLKEQFPNRFKDDLLLQAVLKRFDFNLKDVEAAVIGDDDIEKEVATQRFELTQKKIPQVVSPNENHILHIQTIQTLIQQSQQEPTAETDNVIDQHAKYLEADSPDKFAGGGGSVQASPSSREIRNQGVAKPTELIGQATSTRLGG